MGADSQTVGWCLKVIGSSEDVGLFIYGVPSFATLLRAVDLFSWFSSRLLRKGMHMDSGYEMLVGCWNVWWAFEPSQFLGRSSKGSWGSSLRMLQ